MVLRSHLLGRLNEGLHRKLTLISASAGSGKTTLVGAWVREIDRPVAWLSLDEGDNDPVQFLAYLVAALQTVAEWIGKGALSLLQSSQPPRTEVILTVLLNEIATLTEHFVLVLDDYHVINVGPVDVALTYLVEHLPPQMHLIIATREDPHLPLAHLRASHQLHELRAADLRFTASEAAVFLNQSMGLSLSNADVAQLSESTEGWIAGLQFAALAVQGRQDVPEFIRAFAGDHRYIVDYLVEEVLRHQPPVVRNFLLQTSILDRLSGSLCSAVTGQEKGNVQLEMLEHGNFFVVPLDDRRLWYRYHRLFADVLFARLLEEEPPAQIAMLHRRASEWYEQHGSPGEAIRHALAAEDFARAANLIELAIPDIRRNRQDATLRGWLKALPAELIHCRPALSAGYAWTLLACGELEAAQARLLDAEQWLDMTDPRAPALVSSAGVVVLDEKELRLLPVIIAVYRAACAQLLGDMSGAVKYARQVFDLLPAGEHLGRGAAAALMGLASWARGDLEVAYQTFADGMAHVQIAGNISDALSGTIALADIRVAQGRLHEAMHRYERVLQEALARGEPVLQGTADLYVGMSELHYEHNNLETAMQCLLKSQELSERTGLPYNLSRWYVAMARLKAAHGDLPGALGLFREAERLYVRDFFLDVRPVAALVARVWIAQERSGEALGWARERGLTVADELSYPREFEHITLARVLLARSEEDQAGRFMLEATKLLERLLKAAQEGQRLGSVIEILILQALAHQRQGNSAAALIALRQSLTLAEPEGYVRVFVDEGPSMALLLEEAARHKIAPDYVRQLLAAMGQIESRKPVQQTLIEPLSERELEVLRLLGTDLTGPEIARELVVSLNTLRTHTKNIYGKLCVNTRRAAVRRAAELHLL